MEFPWATWGPEFCGAPRWAGARRKIPGPHGGPMGPQLVTSFFKRSVENLHVYKQKTKTLHFTYEYLKIHINRTKNAKPKFWPRPPSQNVDFAFVVIHFNFHLDIYTPDK